MLGSRSHLVGIGSAIFHPESSRVARMASGGRHGFAFARSDNTIGLSNFVLDMDGTPLTADFVRWSPLGDGLTVSELWYYNFPIGLTGIHEFTRHYFEACNNDSVPCDGNRINTPVEDFTTSAVVTFTTP